MATNTNPDTTTRFSSQVVAMTPKRTILVATDGTAGSEAALRLALTLADEGAHVEALHVVDTRSMPIPPPIDLALALGDAVIGSAVRDDRERELRQQVAATVGRPVSWPVRVALGNPARSIIVEARRIEADFIIVGLRRHNLAERVAMDETSQRVMREAGCPVLGIAGTSGGKPQRIVVAVDFSRASLEAARAAGRLVGADGTLVLAYVAPPATSVPDDGERLIHELGVTSAFAWFRGELDREPGAPVEQVVLARNSSRTVAEVLATFADETGIGMIALGSRRHGRIERWVLGSVTADLVRKGSRSLLVVPPDDSDSR